MHIYGKESCLRPPPLPLIPLLSPHGSWIDRNRIVKMITLRIASCTYIYSITICCCHIPYLILIIIILVCRNHWRWSNNPATCFVRLAHITCRVNNINNSCII